MANITRRTNKDGSPSYLIRVYVHETNTGKQITKSKTWRPPANMRPTAAEKEVRKQAALFEDKVKQGLAAVDGSAKFSVYANTWMEGAQIAPRTRERYKDLLARINQGIGHIRLEKLQGHHLEAFYENLRESGINRVGSGVVSDKLAGELSSRSTSGEELSRLSGVSPSTISTAMKGNRVSIATGEKISKALGVDPAALFHADGCNVGLSEKTILHHHRLISAILERAKRERLIPFNVAKEHATAPKASYKESKYLTDQQAREFLSLLLLEEDLRIKTCISLLLFTGARRGEVCGLSWTDIDYDRQLIQIVRASQYQRGKGVVTVPTKNKSSVRSVKVPVFMIELIKEYREWWDEQRRLYGKSWQGKEWRLFIQSDGKPINPDTINYWLSRFLDKHGWEHISPHSLRHTFATLQITAGVDIRTLQSLTGHAQASTLVNTYSHAIKSAQTAAAETLERVLLPEKSEKIKRLPASNDG